jgi:hypothetical protein
VQIYQLPPGDQAKLFPFPSFRLSSTPIRAEVRVGPVGHEGKRLAIANLQNNFGKR